MDIDKDLFERIQQFVIEERGRYRFPLTFDTTLEGDLKITGDDAVEFIIAFGKKFNIDVSEFDLEAYFGGEGGFLGIMGSLPTPGKIPITLGDLYNVALTGSMLETDSFKQIILFLKDEKWGLSGIFVRRTQLYRDLKLRGNDAREFIEAFVKQFDIDASEFKFDKYFRPRKNTFLSRILDPILRERITLGDLEEAILRKKLV